MKRQTILKSTLCLLMALVCNVAWADFTLSYNQDTNFWGDVITERPSGVNQVIEDASIANAEVHCLSEDVEVKADGTVSVTFLHVNGQGSHCQHIVGVVLKNADGEIADYHHGKAGGTPDKNTYTLSGVTAGDYTLNFYVTRNGNDLVDKYGGTITVTGAVRRVVGSTAENKIFYNIKNVRSGKYANYEGANVQFTQVSTPTLGSYWYLMEVADAQNVPQGYKAYRIYNAANALAVENPGSGNMTANEGVQYPAKVYCIGEHTNGGHTGVVIRCLGEDAASWNDAEGSGTNIANHSYDDPGSIWEFEKANITESQLIQNAVAVKTGVLNTLATEVTNTQRYHYGYALSDIEAKKAEIEAISIPETSLADALTGAIAISKMTPLAGLERVAPKAGDKFTMENNERNGRLTAFASGNYVRCVQKTSPSAYFDALWTLVATDTEGQFKLYNEKMKVYVGVLSNSNNTTFNYVSTVEEAGVYELSNVDGYATFKKVGGDDNSHLHLSNWGDNDTYPYAIVRWNNGGPSQWRLVKAFGPELTTDANNPICYALKSGRDGNYYFTLDNNKVKLFNNRSIATEETTHWYFMLDESGNLKMYSKSDNKAMGYLKGTDGATKLTNDPATADYDSDTYTLYFAPYNQTNYNGAWFALKPSRGDTYVSNHGGTSNYMGFYNNFNDGGTRIAFEPIVTITYTLSDNAGNQFTGTYQGFAGVTLPTINGAYTLSNEAWSDDNATFTATITFPFPVSSESVTNATMISSFKESNGGAVFKWYTDDNAHVKVQKNPAVTVENLKSYSWAIYPSLKDGAFVFSIKNVAANKYIHTEASYDDQQGSHNDANTISLTDTPTEFMVSTDGKSRFYYVGSNKLKQYLSYGSTGTENGYLGVYAKEHAGTTNSFYDAICDLTSKDQFVSGGVYTFVTSRGWVGANEANTAIGTVKTSVTPAPSYGNIMFQWALYQSRNGNYYLYNLGKRKFLGVPENGAFPFVDTPTGKNLTFKENGNADYPIMFSTDNRNAVSQNANAGLFAWEGGWNKMDDAGSNHKVTYIGELDAEQLKTIADLVEAYDRRLYVTAEVEGSWENNPNTHFGSVTATAGESVLKTTLKTNPSVATVDYNGLNETTISFTRAYRGFEFQGFKLGEKELDKKFTLTEEQKASITAENPLVAKFTATEAVTLFYDDDEFSYRIPAIERTSTDRLIAVSDYRHSLDDIGRYNHGAANPGIDLVIRTSDDNGKTWSDTTIIAKGSGVRNSNDCAYGDAAIAVVGEKVLVMAAAGDVFFPHANASNNNRVVRIWNENNGDGDWSKEDISTELFLGENALFPNGYAAFFGSGRMPVDETGRIYGAMLLRNAAAGNNIYVVYSDNLGDTWKILGGSQTQVARADEPKVEILPNGQILLSARRGGGRHFRVFTYGTGETDWANGVGAWSNTKNGCDNGGSNGTNGEIYHLEALNANGQRVNILLQSQPKGGSTEFDRKDVTIWYKEITETNGSYTIDMIADNWREGLQVSYQKSAYSAMTLQEDGRMAFFFEEAPCYGDDQAKGYSMVYMPLTIEQITKSNYFSLDADLNAEHVINVVLTDAQGNEYRQQITSALGGVATKLTTDYPFITLGDNATLESDGESFTYTNTVTLPFKVSNEETTVWHNIYFPINTNENNYPAYMSAAENSDVVKIDTESAAYGNSTLNTLENAGKISWAIYQSEDEDFAFILKNKSNEQYLKTTSEAPEGTGNDNVRYTSSINEAAAFVPSTEGHDQSYQGEYSLKIGNGYVCVWSVGNGYVTYSQKKSHKGAWAKFVEAPDFETLIGEVNATLDMIGDGLGQYTVSEANKVAAAAAKEAMKNSATVKFNELNTYKNLTDGATLNTPKAGQFFRVAYDYGNAGKLYMQSTASGVKGLEFTEATGAASIWVFYDDALYSYTEGQCLRETGNDRGLQAVGGKTTATFSASTRVKGKYNLQCDSYVHANANNGKYYTDHCSSNNCEQHDLILEEVTELPFTISSVGYGTLWAPVALEISEHVKAYTGVVDGDYLVLTKITTGIIPAETGVVIYRDGESYGEDEVPTGATTHNFAITSTTETIDDNAFKGSVATIARTSVQGVAYTLQTHDFDSDGNNEGIAFKKFTGNNITGFKAYLQVPDPVESETPAQALRIRFAGENHGGTTSLESSELNAQGSALIYDLQGRRVLNPTKGMYIVNGKKVIVK